MPEQHYLAVSDGESYRFARENDLGGTKDSLLPPLHHSDDLIKNASLQLEEDDIILDIDNKSITHRPDLWSHRGIAREIAALMNLPLKKESHFLTDLSEKIYEKDTKKDSYPVSISVQTDKCTRFSGLYFKQLPTQKSLLWMMHRLYRIEERAINATIDITNYVLFDIGQPLHAFDAQTITNNTLIVAQKALTKHYTAHKDLTLLDGQNITLSPDDIIVGDEEKPLALAGIKGGKSSGISDKTTTVFLEAGHFDATTIRHSAQRHKLRTNASARFEKSIDPFNTTKGIQRFLHLIKNAGFSYKVSPEIITIGSKYTKKTLVITHNYITKRIGVEIEQSFIITTLEKIGFTVTSKNDKNELIYCIEVPSYRATKDITIKDDIVEEIVRFYGYSSLPFTLPHKQMSPHNLNDMRNKVHRMKEFFAYHMKMRELYNYAFYDESFISLLPWQPTQAVEVKNPVSEKYKRLVTSLIPGLLQALVVNHKEDRMNFFEIANTWKKSEVEGVTATEKASIAGVFFDKKTVDFYTMKKQLIAFFSAYNITPTWHQVKVPASPWYMPYQTAELHVNGVCIGTVGKVLPSFLHSIIDGDAFLFEIDATILCSYKQQIHRYHPTPKYESVMRDVTVELPLLISAEQCIQEVKKSNDMISTVFLRDIYQKDDWFDKKALTFRFAIQPVDKTLTKEEIDTIESVVHKKLLALK